MGRFRLIFRGKKTATLDLDGGLIGGVVHVSRGETTAELLDPDPSPYRSSPVEHEFPTFEALLQWLGSPDVRWRERQAA